MLADRQHVQWGLATLGRGAFVVGTAAGTLVTAYALGVAVGGPIVTLPTLSAFLIANLITVLATGFGVIVATRFTTGAVHGLFIGAASMAAADLVEPGRHGRALAVVFGGITISTVVGVPPGTLIGQRLGSRATFLAITVLGVGALIIGGQFIVLTFMAPFLGRVTGVPGGTISVFLFACGVATAAGAMVGGWAAVRNAAGTLVWGLAGFGLVSTALQPRVIRLAGCGGSLGASAANVGIALGGVPGGAADGAGQASSAQAGAVAADRNRVEQRKLR